MFKTVSLLVLKMYWIISEPVWSLILGYMFDFTSRTTTHDVTSFVTFHRNMKCQMATIWAPVGRSIFLFIFHNYCVLSHQTCQNVAFWFPKKLCYSLVRIEINNDHPGLLLSETVYISSPELLCQVIRIARNVPLGKCCYFSGHVNIGMIFHKLWTFIVEYFMYKFESGVFDIVHNLQYSNIC